MADSRQVQNKAVYVALGVSRDGTREVLGLWLAGNEGAKFWLSVMNELKNRGVQDILIAVVDGLKGFPEAITAAFPDTTVQTRIVHVVRHSLNFCSWKDRKMVAADLRRIYEAVSVVRARPRSGMLPGRSQVEITARYAHLAADPVIRRDGLPNALPNQCCCWNIQAGRAGNRREMTKQRKSKKGARAPSVEALEQLLKTGDPETYGRVCWYPGKQGHREAPSRGRDQAGGMGESRR